MPPKVREVRRYFLEHGWVEWRKGKGDHVIYRNPSNGNQYSLDGSPSHEVPMPVWRLIQKIVEEA